MSICDSNYRFSSKNSSQKIVKKRSFLWSLQESRVVIENLARKSEIMVEIDNTTA